MWDKDKEDIERLISEEAEKEHNDPDYQQYIEMCKARSKKQQK